MTGIKTSRAAVDQVEERNPRRVELDDFRNINTALQRNGGRGGPLKPPVGHRPEAKASRPSAWSAVTELLGPEAAAALAARYAGGRIQVPSRIRPDSALSRLIGYDAASLLAARFGCCKICVPKGRGSFEHRDREIREARRAGGQVPEIAHQWGLSERHVWRIISGADKSQHP